MRDCDKQSDCDKHSDCDKQSVFDFVTTKNAIEDITADIRIELIRMPTNRSVLDHCDYLDSIGSERTPTSANFHSIEDPLPSYDQFPTVTPENVNIHRPSLERLREPVSPRLQRPTYSELFPPRQEMEVKQEPADEMSLPMNDVGCYRPPCHLDMPLSPVSSEASTDTSLSSELSDVEVNPRGRRPPTTRRHRRRRVTENGSCPQLWQFILELLGDRANAQVISWNGIDYQFKVNNSKELARLWGARKNKPRMNFDKLSRAMRYYYDKNIIRHIPGQRLVYEFCSNEEDQVYTKLLEEAARTMPTQPVLTQHSPYRPFGISSAEPQGYLTRVNTAAGEVKYEYVVPQGPTVQLSQPISVAAAAVSVPVPSPGYDSSLDQYLPENEQFLSTQALLQQFEIQPEFRMEQEPLQGMPGASPSAPAMMAFPDHRYSPY